MKLTGCSALITGASKGLGLEIARRFLAEGAAVALCARDAERLAAAADELRAEATASRRIFARSCDVADAAAVDAFADEAMGALGSIQILVNNAGVYGPKGPIESVDISAWIQALEINVHGVVLTCRALIPHFKRQGRGKIINLSGGGATAPLPFLSAYAASKAAVVRLTETLAGELREHRIDVNAVAPGALNTRMLEEVLAAGPSAVGEAFYRKALEQKESGGTPIELGAGLCAWLASSESDGISGRLLSAKWDPWQTLAAQRAALAESDIYTLRRIIPKDRGQDWG